MHSLFFLTNPLSCNIEYMKVHLIVVPRHGHHSGASSCARWTRWSEDSITRENSRILANLADLFFFLKLFFSQTFWWFNNRLLMYNLNSILLTLRPLTDFLLLVPPLLRFAGSEMNKIFFKWCMQAGIYSNSFYT